MDEPNQLAVWCVRQRSEIFVNDLRREYAPYAVSFELADQMFQRAQDGGQVNPVRLSMIYVPLLLQGRVLGCIAVQSGV
ncbi:GAF domain-containing protein, partial [Acinetobacter baumannii]